MATLEWISTTTNETIDLTGWVDSVALERGAQGLIGGPPTRGDTDYVPGLPGGMRRSIIHDIRTLELPIIGIDAGPAAVMELVRKMVLAMDPILNEAILRFTNDAGEQSDLNARVTQGLETQGLGNDGPNAQRLALKIEATDPYWYRQPVQKSYNTEIEEAHWFPFPPLVLKSQSIFGESFLDVPSDVPVYPLWKVVGPGIGLRLTNLTTGEGLSFDDTAILAAGQSIDIDTRPRGDTARTVIGPNGENWFGKLLDRSLWPLVPGRNDLDIAFAETDPQSYVALTYRNARLTP